MYSLGKISLCAAFILTACPGPRSSQETAPDLGTIFVRVVNRNLVDVLVSVSHDGMRNNLGLAVASSTTEFTLPLRLLGAGREYHLVGDPVGMRIFVTTETLHGQAGDEVTWSLEDSFARSTVVVH